MSDQSHSSNRLLPPKFSGTDKPISFLQWKNQVELYILSKEGDLFNELLLPRPVPEYAPDATEAAKKAARVAAWAAIPDDQRKLYQEQKYVKSKSKTANVQLIITSLLDDTLSGEYIGQEYRLNPKKIWDTINQRYNRYTEGTKQEIQIELNNTYMKRGETIDTHLSKLNNIYNRMSIMGIPPDDSTKIFNLLNRLSEDYKATAATLKTQSNEMKIERMIVLLKDRNDEIERQKKTGDNREEEKEVAHIAHEGRRMKQTEERAAFVRGGGYGKEYERRQSNRRNAHPYHKRNDNNNHEKRKQHESSSSSSHKSTDMQCYNCQQKGHISYDCKNKPVCRSCKKTGHRKEDCWNEKGRGNGNNDKRGKGPIVNQFHGKKEGQERRN